MPDRAAAPPALDGGRQWRRKARTRARLLEAARHLVAERGMDLVTMSDVTQAAELSTGTIYNYFPSFSQLADALVHEEIDRFGDALDGIREKVSDPAEVLSASLRLLVGHAASDPVWARFYVRLGVAHPTVVEILGPRCRRDLQAGIDAGVFNIPDLTLMVAMIFGALTGTLAIVSGDPNHQEAPENYAEAMLRAVGLPPAEAYAIARRPLPHLDA